MQWTVWTSNLRSSLQQHWWGEQACWHARAEQRCCQPEASSGDQCMLQINRVASWKDALAVNFRCRGFYTVSSMQTTAGSPQCTKFLWNPHLGCHTRPLHAEVTSELLTGTVKREVSQHKQLQASSSAAQGKRDLGNKRAGVTENYQDLSSTITHHSGLNLPKFRLN